MEAGEKGGGGEGEKRNLQTNMHAREEGLPDASDPRLLRDAPGGIIPGPLLMLNSKPPCSNPDGSQRRTTMF